MAEALAMALGVGFLYVFYRAVETSWPTNYFSVGQKTDETVSRSLPAYLLFRFGPVYATCVFAGAALANSQSAVVVPVIAIAAIHAALTSGRMLFELGRNHALQSRPLVTGLNVGVLVLTIIVGVVAALSASAFKRYIPTGDELSSSLWTAVFAAVIGAFLLRVTTAAATSDPAAGFARSRASITDELWIAAADAADSAGAEPRLVHAFMLVENAQRPKWTRQLERAVGRVVGRGTYGPLQVTSDSPLADADALRVAIADRFAGRRVPVVTQSWGTSEDTQWLKVFASNYNPDTSYADDVVSAYQWVERPYGHSLAASAHPDDGGLPHLEIYSLRRNGADLQISGAARGTHDAVYLRFLDSSGTVLDVSQVSVTGSSRLTRRQWREAAVVPSGATEVEASVDPHGGEPERQVRLPI